MRHLPPDEGRWIPEDPDAWKRQDDESADGFSVAEFLLESLAWDADFGEDGDDEDIDVSDEAMLEGIVEHRGTAMAREYVDLLALNTVDDPDSTAARYLIAQIRSLTDNHGFSADERLYVLTEVIRDLELSIGERHPRYEELRTAMCEAMDLEDARDYDDPARNTDWEEYKRCEAAWIRVIDEQVADWLEEVGETELAPLFRGDKTERAARALRGEIALCGDRPETRFAGW